jgi:hypothetical protein
MTRKPRYPDKIVLHKILLCVLASRALLRALDKRVIIESPASVVSASASQAEVDLSQNWAAVRIGGCTTPKLPTLPQTRGVFPAATVGAPDVNDSKQAVCAKYGVRSQYIHVCCRTRQLTRRFVKYCARIHIASVKEQGVCSVCMCVCMYGVQSTQNIAIASGRRRSAAARFHSCW